MSLRLENCNILKEKSSENLETLKNPELQQKNSQNIQEGSKETKIEQLWGE